MRSKIVAAAILLCSFVLCMTSNIYAVDTTSVLIGDTTVTFDTGWYVLDDGRDKEACEVDRFADVRMNEESIDTYNGIYILNRNFMFEPISISTESADEYASIVNEFAKALPEVNVYNMIVPDAYELFAPTDYSTNQLKSMEYVYKHIDDSVTPVRIVNALADHRSEKLYFYMDHHWTQRGAYYAWERFMQIKEENVPQLSEFSKNDTWFTGSLAQSIAEDERDYYIDSDTELLERFMPVYDTVGAAYRDMYMQDKIYDIETVNTGFSNYVSFITGDNPLSVVVSGVDNGKSIAIIKESVGNALATWAVNNYEYVYVIDIRGFEPENFSIRDFYDFAHFDDLLIESYPVTIESADLRNSIKGLL